MHEVAQHQRGGHVEARVGLVEDQDVRIVEQRADDQHLLFHALRIGADRLLGGIGEAKELEQGLDALFEHGLGNLAQAADQLELLASGQE